MGDPCVVKGKGKAVPVLNQGSRHEGTWTSGGTAPQPWR
jgi:hypothetical protein